MQKYRNSLLSYCDNNDILANELVQIAKYTMPENAQQYYDCVAKKDSNTGKIVHKIASQFGLFGMEVEKKSAIDYEKNISLDNWEHCADFEKNLSKLLNVISELATVKNI